MGCKTKKKRLSNGGKINNTMIRKNFKSKLTPRLANGGMPTYNYTNPDVVNTDFNIGSVATGALSGAATGMTVGGPWGALAGAVIGGGISAFGANKEQQAAIDQRNDIIAANKTSKAGFDRARLNMLEQSIGTPQTLYAAKGGKVKRVGAGIQVKGNPGTDTIPMNIDGQRVMLDNNEIIVRDAQGNAVVLSDDLGTADKYRRRLSNGGNPQLEAMRLAEEAKMLNPNPTGRDRYLGGEWPPSTVSGMDLYIDNQINRYTPNRITGTSEPTRLNINSNGRIVSGKSKPTTLSIDTLSTKTPASTNKNRFNMLNKYYDLANMAKNRTRVYGNMPNKFSIDNPNDANTIDFTGTSFIDRPSLQTNNNTQVIRKPTSNYPKIQMTNPTVGKFNPKAIPPATTMQGETSGINDVPLEYKIGQYVKNNPENVAQGLGFLATTVGNISAANRLAKTRMAANNYATPMMLDPNVNRPIFENQISDIKRSSRNLGQQILGNTSNSAVALARLNALRSGEQGNIDRVRSQQVADRGNILNRNIEQANRFNLYNTDSSNRYNMMNYQDQINRINTGLGLTRSTVDSLNNIVDNIRMGKYQQSQLQALANKYNLTDWDGTTEGFIKALQKLSKEELQTAINND